MDDLQALQLDVEEILDELRAYWLDRDESRYNEAALSRVQNKGANMMFCCPHHPETRPSCGILSDYPYSYNCFGCGASGNLAQLVAYVVGLPTEAHGVHHILRNFVDLEVSERPPINLDDILDGRELDRKRSLPDEEAQKYSSKRHPYMYQRGFSEHTLRTYEIGYDEATDSLTFPVRTTQGRLRFIKRRSVSTKSFLNEKDIFKRDIIYGLHFFPTNRITEIYLNESETDTLACYEGKLPAGAILGRILFKEQVLEMMKAGIKTVNLFLDNDKYGVDATIKAYQMISKLAPIRVNVVLYPGGHWGISGTADMVQKDANDLLKSRQINQIKVVPYEQFYQLLKNETFIMLKELNSKQRNDRRTP